MRALSKPGLTHSRLVARLVCFASCAQNGQYAVHYAAYMNLQDVLRLLLERKPLLNEVDTVGNTALHMASIGGAAECCALLVKAGADKTIKNDVRALPRACLHARVALLRC